jgi:hypothetical protein
VAAALSRPSCLDPLGLRLASRVFLERDSERDEPRITLEIFCTVRSVIDSVRVSFGDLTEEFSAVALVLLSDSWDGEGGGCWGPIVDGPVTAGFPAVVVAEVLFSSRKLPDFLILTAGWAATALSLLLAPSSMFKLLHAFSSVFFSSFCPGPAVLPLLLLLLPLPAPLFLSDDLLLVKEARILFVMLWAAEVAVLRLALELVVAEGGGET